MSHRPKWRNGRLRCGDDVEIAAVATTSAPGGNTGGPLTSRSRSDTPRSSSMTRAAITAVINSGEHERSEDVARQWMATAEQRQ